MKIKILIATPIGLQKKEGISTVILDYFSRFDKGMFDIDIIASLSHDYKLEKEFQEAGINVQILPSRKDAIFKYINSLAELFRQNRYDVMYVHGSSALMSIELLIAKMYGCKVRIAHCHNTTCDHKRIDKILRPLFNNLYTGALACGEEAGKWMFGSRTFKIVKNGRDISTYRFDPDRRDDVRKKLGISEDILVIGHVGNFNSQKNHVFLIKIFKEIIKLRSNSKLYLMGTGKTQDDIKHLVEKQNLSEKVVFTGSISNVPDMLQAMDVMLLPSLHEGLPLVVVEWQIAALPCLISDSITRECAYTDLVQFISLEEKPEIWAKKVIDLAGYDRQKTADIVINLTEKNGFDIKKNVDDLQEYFEKEYRIRKL